MVPACSRYHAIRMTQVKVLAQRLQHLKTKRVSLALGITGGPGIGKSFTARGAVETARLPFLTINANASNPMFSKAWLELIDERTQKCLPQWVFGLLERSKDNETVPLEGMVQVCVTILAMLTPFVLLVEDLHDANEAQLERWTGLARALPKGAGLLLTSRTALPEILQSIPLMPLDETATKGLLEAEVGEVLPESASHWIFERSRGNPLFSLEYLRDLRRRGALSWRGSDWHWEAPQRQQLPNTIEAMIEYVLEGIETPDARNALEARAMLGSDDAELWSVAANLNEMQIGRVERDLQQLGIWRGQDFAHPLFREVTVKRTPNDRCERMAKRLFEYLEPHDPIRAATFVHAANLDTSLARQTLQRAIELEADQSRRAALKVQAFEFCPMEKRVEEAYSAAIAIREYNLDESGRLLDIVLAIQPDHLEAAGERAQIYAARGQTDRGKALLKNLEPKEGVESPHWWWQWYSFLENIDQASLAWDVYQAHPEIHDLMSIKAQANLTHFMLSQGWFERADERLAVLLSRADIVPRDRITILDTQITAAVMRNQKKYSLELTQAAYEYYRSTSDFQADKLPLLLFGRATIHAELRNFRQAQCDFQEASQAWLERGSMQRAALAQGLLSDCLTDLGQYTQAENGLLEARNTLQSFQNQRFLFPCESRLARLYLIWRPANGGILALKHARAAAHLANELKVNVYRMTTLLWLSLCEIEFGTLETLPALLDEFHELTKTHARENWWYWVDGLYQARIGQLEPARQQLKEALRLCQDERDNEYPLIELELNRINGDAPAAQTQLAMFREMGFLAGVTLVLRYFPELQTLPNQPAFNAATLRINTLGSLQVVSDGVVLPLRGAKRKHLAALLLEAQLGGRDECKHNDLAEALYPNATEDEARAAIRQLVFQWRNQFGMSSIIKTDNGYAFGRVSSDAQQFLETGQTNLWRGTYFEDVDEWETRAFETVREALYIKLKQQARALIPDDAPEAARLAKILLEAEPFDTEALAIALRALQAQGSYTSISRMYKRSRYTWLEVGEKLPEHWTEFLSQVQIVQ